MKPCSEILGKVETASIDNFYTFPVPYWETHTWYSDKPLNGGNYQTVGDISGIPNQSYGLIYGGDMTEQTLNFRSRSRFPSITSATKILGYLTQSK